jgi:hypothetical protein
VSFRVRAITGIVSVVVHRSNLSLLARVFCFVGAGANDTEDPAHSQRPTLNFTYRSSIEALGRYVVVLG